MTILDKLLIYKYYLFIKNIENMLEVWWGLELCRLEKLTLENKENVILRLWWYWSREVHNDMVSFFVTRWFDFFYFNRNQDIAFWQYNNVVKKYLEKLNSVVENLINNWKSVHLVWNSFGWYLTLRLIQEYQNEISSILGLAPLINPLNAINILGIQKFSILENNLQDLEWINELTLRNTLILLWENDWLTNFWELRLINWARRILLPGIYHSNISTNPHSLELIRNFYSSILENNL